MKFWIPLAFILAMSAAASATDISGYFGGNGNFYGGFTGRFDIVGNVGNSGSTPPGNCGTGVIDASTGCPLPMLGM